MSFLPDWLSDDYCRLSTGGGLSKRQLYSDEGEIVINVKRPLVLNGIDEFVARGDLASRSIVLHLPTIGVNGRLSEKDFWKSFEEKCPFILGAIFTGISTALANQETTPLNTNLRMIDSWHWASSAETAFGWKEGSINEAIERNQVKANQVVLESSILYPSLKEIARKGFTGSPANLLSKIRDDLSSDFKKVDERDFPKNAKILSDRLRRLNPALRSIGIDVQFGRTNGSNSERTITLGVLKDTCVASVAPTQLIQKSDVCDARKRETNLFDLNFEGRPPW